MDQGPHPLERETSREDVDSYIGDRIVCLLQFAFLVVLPVGVELFGADNRSGGRATDGVFPGAPTGYSVMGFLCLWFFLWFGYRGAYVIYAVIIGFATLTSMIEKHGTPWFGIFTITYLMLRLTHSMGPKLTGSKD